MPAPIVVVGAGQAGAQLCASLRTGGYRDPVILAGEEPEPPYQRPPLSKQLLAGAIPYERALFKPPAFYEEQGIELRLDARADGIDRGARVVTLAGGEAIEYQALALATGSRVRRLSIPGAGLENVFYLRTLADMRAIQARLHPAARLAIVGGGYIGLEVASVAVKMGVRVTVLEQASRLMERTAGAETSEFYRRVHAEAGVELRTGVRVVAFEGDGEVRQVTCEDGNRLDTDLVIVGIGILPNTELAAAAGLEVGDGIVVDEHARTSDPAIVAAGDCTCHPSPALGRRVRLESVPNALAQARTAAATLCGESRPYAEAPWFWSDQYDLKLQITGLLAGHDRTVMRGRPEDRRFFVFYLRGDRVIAVEAVNQVREFVHCKALVARGAEVSADRLADESVPLKEIAA